MIPDHLRLPLLLVLFLVQIGIPVRTILVHDEALEEGTAWRFRTAPVDPYDAFRGRYVSLAFDAARTDDVPDWLDPGEQAWAVLAEDPAGFARIADLQPERPADEDAIRVRLLWHDEGGTGTLELPFERYYMPEDLAPRAEQAARDRTTDEGDDFVVVRVRGATAVLEDLYVDGRPIREVLEAP